MIGMLNCFKLYFFRIFLFGFLIFPLIARADTASEIQELRKRLDQLEKSLAEKDKALAEKDKALEEKTDTLAAEIEDSKLSLKIPQKAELKSQWGLGPAASGVYNVKQGLSFGGYGEANARSFVSDANGKKNETDLLRLITYVGYKFSDSIIFNSEIEFEHGTTDAIGGQSGDSAGEVSVEFAYLDFLIDQSFNARVGNVLIPMGFINEIHEPAYFHGVLRPDVERFIIPTTWRENGFGFFGQGQAAGKIDYRTYLVNGLRASRFEDTGIREGRQSGNRALIEDIAWTGRFDYSPDAITGLVAGGSFWVGNSGQDEDFDGQTPNVRTSMISGHAQYQYRNLELRTLGVWGNIDDAAILSSALDETIGNKFYGWYFQSAYNILPLFSETTQYLAPFFRFEDYDTQASVPTGFSRDNSLARRVYITGLTYKPLTNVALKLDYRHYLTDDVADEVALGMGFSF